MLLTVISLSLLWSLVEVHSQSFPYASFMGQTLASHSYVDLSLVGDSKNYSVQCITVSLTPSYLLITETGGSQMEIDSPNIISLLEMSSMRF